MSAGKTKYRWDKKQQAWIPVSDLNQFGQYDQDWTATVKRIQAQKEATETTRR